MPDDPGDKTVRRLLVVLPNWVGDVVLATPVLAALRVHFVRARIAYLMRRYVSEVVDGGGWHDEAVHWPDGRGLTREIRTLRLARRLREQRYGLALLLTNSFRSALVAWRAGIPRRVGYARDGRGWMLTDRLRPLKQGGQFVPTPVLPYYVAIAEAAGCRVTDRKLRLGITAQQEAAGRELLRHYGLDDGRPFALINPGAAFGASKCWLPERFTEVCDRLHAEHGFRAVLVGAPHEVPLMRKIAADAKTDVVCCAAPGTTLGSLKVLAREAALLVCNDTGPRHYGNAFNIPTVTIFGPTHQAWTDTGYDGEIKLQIPVECGPCQLPVCPIDLRCMTGLTVDMVMQAVTDVLARRRAPAMAAASVATEQRVLYTEQMRIDPAYRERLRACGVEDVSSVLTRIEGRVAAWSRTTDTLHVPGLDGLPGFYVKRYYFPRWSNRLRSALRGTFFGMHRGQAEYLALSTMRAAGIPAVRAVAYGGRRWMHFLTACFLITEEVPEAVNLTTFAAEVTAGRRTLSDAQRRAMIRTLATQVAEMHAAGVSHGNLFWRNILVRSTPDGQPEFFFLDAQPLHAWERFGNRGQWWLRELAQLTVSALPFATRRERLRFVRYYLGHARLTPEVRAQADQIERLAQTWCRHEERRIRMNGLFEQWNRQLAEEERRLGRVSGAVAAEPSA